MQIVSINKKVEDKILTIRDQQVILDSDVAELYNVETKRINEAIKNNPEKFPKGYMLELNKKDKIELVENFDRFENLKHSTVLPKAFTERGLYMLATILKSPRATATTIAIIDAFVKMREIKHTIIKAVKYAEEGKETKKMITQVGKLVGDLIAPDDEDLETISVEDEAEFKFMGVLKLKRKIVRKRK